MCFKKFKKKISKRQEHLDDYLHVFDETFPQPASAGIASWNNVHGYAAKNGYDYYACVDMRTLGIRVQDIVVRCNDEEEMRDWLKDLKYTTYAIDRIKNLKRGIVERGTEKDACFTFNTTDGKSKYYNITGYSDFYVDQHF